MTVKQNLGRQWRQMLTLCLPILVVAGVLVAGGFGSQPEPVDTGQATEPPLDGKVLYATHCASCHGIDGEGQPNWQIPDASGVFPAPPHNSDGHTWHHPDQVLLEITAKGGVMPNSGMPGFADKLTQPEMEAVLAHIKIFWEPDQRTTQADVTDRWQ